MNTELCSGDAVRVGERSRAALRMVNESTLRLDQNTTLTLASIDQGVGFFDLLSGVIHVITRTPRPFKIHTPIVNAGVEGTEFLVRVDEEVAQVVAFEGRVSVSNNLGEIRLVAGAAALAQRDGAPRAMHMVHPADAVQWALYYPRVIDVTEIDDASLREADALARSGDIGGSFARLEATPDERRGLRYHAWRAELLLRVGRVDEARTALTDALKVDPRSSDVEALLATIAVAQNDKPGAMNHARHAVAFDPQSVAAHLALSYAEQAHFDIAAALASAERATALGPMNALAWARVAELRLAEGDQGGALAAARSATDVAAGLARTQTVLGFVHLMRIETAAARKAFSRAIELDQADALPRLGLGSARIRDGELTAGREAIEIAASLDPLNSLIRSYLGKAYFEERRDVLASAQFGVARQLDMNDPTPWFYDAILQRSWNRPVEALGDVQKSIELNDRRAVYRSRLLLDEDLATRQISLASVYSELSADREAVSISSRSLADEPSNGSAHRFLSEAYATRDRYDIARTSELLQAQLLEPLSLSPASPEVAFTDLSLPRSAAQSAIFENDSTSVFERNQVKANIGALSGNLGTSGSRAQVYALQGPVAVSVGLFEYQTDGFRPNADLRHRISNLFMQFAVTPSLSVQAEYRDRHTSQGDVAMSFNPDFFSPSFRATVDEHSMRVGGTLRPAPGSVWVASAVRNQRRAGQQFAVDGVVDGVFAFDDTAASYEMQYQRTLPSATLIAGIGHTRVASVNGLKLDFTPLGGEACPSDRAPCEGTQSPIARQWNGYLYVNLKPTSALAATVGLSRDHYGDGAVLINRWNPKFGLRWTPRDEVTVRAAAFSTVKRSLAAQQTIEPTQVVGFNQLYDDIVGSISRFYTAAIDVKPSRSVSLGAEGGAQRSRIGTGGIGATFAAIPVQQIETDWLRFDVSSRMSSALVASIGVFAERFRFNPTIPTDSPTNVMTTRVPLTLRSFIAGGYFGEIVTTGVAQRVRRLPESTAPVGSDRFVVVDLSLGYRLPSRWGTLSLDVKNLFGRRFSYQDDDFRSTESRVGPYLPVRRVWIKASLAL